MPLCLPLAVYDIIKGVATWVGSQWRAFNQDPSRYIKWVSRTFIDWLELRVGLEPRPPNSAGERVDPNEDEEGRRLRRLRNKEYLRKFKLYYYPPRWSKRWWWRLPGRTVSGISSWSKSVTETIAKAVWKSFLNRWFWFKTARAPEAEVAAMLFVRHHTTIPVPRPWLSFTWDGLPRIIMERVPGTTLEAVWYDLTPEDKDRYVEQLADVIRQLRSLETPFGSMICSASGGAFMDHRIRLFNPVGPYANEDEFNQATLAYVPTPHPTPEQLGHHIRHPIVFTHNDFAMRNVMVKDGRITGVIDWEGAGWLPAHWEYVKAHDTNTEGDHVVGAFRPYTSLIVPSYPVELEADLQWVAPPRVIRRHI